MLKDSIEVRFGPGEHISKAAEVLCEAAHRVGRAHGSFNDIVLTADASSMPGEIVAQFDKDQKAAAERWRNSDAGRAYEAERLANIERDQKCCDEMFAALPSLDFASDIALLDWCAAYQEPSDRLGVDTHARRVLGIFWAHGYRPNVNLGSDYKSDDRDNATRYLIGQALSGLEHVGSIHGVYQKFYGEWRAKFAPDANH